MFEKLKARYGYVADTKLVAVVGNEYNANYLRFMHDLVHGHMDNEVYTCLLEIESREGGNVFTNLYATIPLHEYATKGYTMEETVDAIESHVIEFINDHAA